MNNGRIISKKRINMIKLNIYKNFNMNQKENTVEDTTIDKIILSLSSEIYKIIHSFFSKIEKIIQKHN
jgi:hypothetical protein